jgi:hypothetical protein
VPVVERVVAPMVLPSRNSAAVVGAVARLPQPGWWRFFVDRLKEPQALRISQAAAQELSMVWKAVREQEPVPTICSRPAAHFCRACNSSPCHSFCLLSGLLV